jgi:hypothetical protein
MSGNGIDTVPLSGCCPLRQNINETGEMTRHDAYVPGRQFWSVAKIFSCTGPTRPAKAEKYSLVLNRLDQLWKETLSNVLRESPFVSVSTFCRGHPSCLSHWLHLSCYIKTEKMLAARKSCYFQFQSLSTVGHIFIRAQWNSDSQHPPLPASIKVHKHENLLALI